MQGGAATGAHVDGPLVAVSLVDGGVKSCLGLGQWSMKDIFTINYPGNIPIIFIPG